MNPMKWKIGIALVAILSTHAFGAIPTELPKRMNKEELAVFREELKERYGKTEAKTGLDAELQHQIENTFYTGKPYLPTTGTYAFKYREYNPNLARWTSEDPSGFPDGANNSYYAPTPTSEFDWMGLERKKLVIIQENYSDTIVNKITMSMKLTDLPSILFMQQAKFNEFKNSIAQAYSVGDEITKGTKKTTFFKAINDDHVLLDGYPKSRIISIEYADVTVTNSLDFVYHAYIKSIKEYQYGPAE